MKTVILFTTLLLAAGAAVGEPTDHQKKKISSQITEELEAELLEAYVCNEDQAISLDTILIYDKNFELVETIEIAFYELDQQNHDLLSKSKLLIDDGKTVIYQIQE